MSRGWFLALEVHGQVSTPLPPCAVMKLQWTWTYWGVFIMKKIFYIRVGRLNVLIFNIMWASTVTVFLKVFFFTLKYHTSTVSSCNILNQILWAVAWTLFEKSSADGWFQIKFYFDQYFWVLYVWNYTYVKKLSWIHLWFFEKRKWK